MPKRLKSYTNFNKGMNDSATPDTLMAEELREAYNIDLMMRGGYSQRKGCVKALLNSLGETPIQRIIDYPGKKLVIVGNKLKDWDGNEIFTFASGNVGWQFFTNQKLYLVDGTKYYVYNGTTVAEVTPAAGADLTAIKRCTQLLQRGQRMFATGDPQNPNHMYFSETGDPTNFKVTSIVKAITDDKEALNAIDLFHQAVVAFKRSHVYAWTGWDPNTDVRFDPVDVHTGTEAPGSVVKAENYMLYLGQDAVMALVGLEQNQVSTMRTSPGLTELIKTLTNRDKAVGVYHKGSYYLACCNDGTGVNNLVLKGHVSMAYSTTDDQTGWQKVFPWTVYTGWKVSQWFVDESDNLYFGSAVTGMIYKAFVGYSDDGVAYTMRVVHRLNLADVFRVKKLKYLLLLAKQEEQYACTVDLKISYGYSFAAKRVNLDESGSWDIGDWDEVVWDSDDIVMKEILTNKKCSRVEITVTHNTVDEPVTIYGFGAVYKPKKPKGGRTGVYTI
jgi:hypothetical protein